MNHKFVILLSLLTFSSCGALKWLGGDAKDQARVVASMTAQGLLMEDNGSFATQIDEKLLSLHAYYLIGRKNLLSFDESISGVKFKDLQRTGPYLSLLAVKTQVDEIEQELKQVYLFNAKTKTRATLLKNELIRERIREFAQSRARSSSVENLAEALGMDLPSTGSGAVSASDYEEEWKKLETLREFQIYEKNIEHLSHMLDSSVPEESSKFYPSPLSSGNLTGNEFPAKVWALTFEDGPGKYTDQIVRELNSRNLTATFFQLNGQLETTGPTPGLKEHEIAAHSWNHLQLLKVGSLTLDKEIPESHRALEKTTKSKVRFYRLPYGAGLTSPEIREKIATSGLIHVLWNVDSLDWMPQKPSEIVKRTKALIKKSPKDAGIILFHDVHRRSAEAAPEIMDYLKQDGRRSCTLGTIVTQLNEGSETVCPLK